jgi:hypothetical protein
LILTLKHHKTLTPEKWSAFSFGKQILMIGNELNRAKNLISRESFTEVKLCYERALELLYLTIVCSKKYTQIFELERLKEVIAELYIQKVPSLEKNNLVFSSLISLSSESYSLLHP